MNIPLEALDKLCGPCREMIDSHVKEVPDTISHKLLNYIAVLHPWADIHYGSYSRQDDDDYSNETRIINFLNKTYQDRNVVKLVDESGKLSHPPIDAYCNRYVYEFKFTGKFTNFHELSQTQSKGAFVDKFKVEHLEIACGRILCRHPNDSHFEEGYYMYVDRLRNLYSLSLTEIRQKVKALELVENWGGGKRSGWMIHTKEWNFLGRC